MTSKIKKVLIIQPAVPEYRISFFEELSKMLDLTIYTTKSDFLGVDTTYSSEYLLVSDGFIKILNFFWHKKLPIVRGYSEFDYIVVNGNPRVLNYMLVILVQRCLGKEVIWWGHGWSAGSRGVTSKLRLYLAKLANKLLVYTEYERNLLSNSHSHVYSLNNGLDSERIRKSFEETPTIAKNSMQTRFVFIGRLTYKSNIKLLIDALAELDNNIVLDVIGNGPLLSSIELTIKANSLLGRVHLHGALYSEEKIAAIMKQADCFVYPGAVGLSLIHAFNYSLPAIIHSNRENHMPEFAAFEDGITGFSFVENDLQSLVSTMQRFVDLDFLERKYLRRNSQLVIEQSYNTRDMSRRFVEMLDL